jgi:hypothetical protein
MTPHARTTRSDRRMPPADTISAPLTGVMIPAILACPVRAWNIGKFEPFTSSSE